MRPSELFRLATTVAIATVIAACGETPATPEVETIVSLKPGGGRGGGPGAGDPVLASSLTFRDLADGIYSDGAGPYVDGLEHAEVAITADDFHFKASTHKKGQRRYWVDLGPASAGTSPFSGPQELGRGADLRIIGGLRVLPCGPSSAAGKLAWIGDQGQGPWHELSFGRAGDGGDPLDVNRADNGDGTSTWTVSAPGPSEFYVDNVWVGTFAVPFGATITGEGGC